MLPPGSAAAEIVLNGSVGPATALPTSRDPRMPAAEPRTRTTMNRNRSQRQPNTRPPLSRRSSCQRRARPCSASEVEHRASLLLALPRVAPSCAAYPLAHRDSHDAAPRRAVARRGRQVRPQVIGPGLRCPEAATGPCAPASTLHWTLLAAGASAVVDSPYLNSSR